MISDHVEVERRRLGGAVLDEHQPHVETAAAFVDVASQVANAQPLVMVGFAELLADLEKSRDQVLPLVLAQLELFDGPLEGGRRLDLTGGWNRSRFCLRRVLSAPA